MVKKNHIPKGELYEHAKKELELAGLTGGKGNLDQSVYHTTLKLIEHFERVSSKSKLMGDTVRSLFNTFSQGEVINDPTDDPNEWVAAPGIGDGVVVLKRCNKFYSLDGGVTWRRTDDPGAVGISKKVTEVSDGSESKEDVQPTEG